MVSRICCLRSHISSSCVCLHLESIPFWFLENFDESNRAIFNHPTGGLVKSLLFWHRIVRMFNKFMVHAWSWHGGLSLEVFYIGALRSKLILACQEGLKWVCPPLHLYRIYFVQTYKIESIVCKTTKTRPNLWMNGRITLMWREKNHSLGGEWVYIREVFCIGAWWYTGIINKTRFRLWHFNLWL